MEFILFIKIKKRYEKRLIIPPLDSGTKFFENLNLLIQEQLDIIKNDIMSFSNSEFKISLKRPIHPKREIQEKLDKLINIRKVNIETYEKIKELLKDIDFIICKFCNNKMKKIPIGIPYTKIGNNYILNGQFNNINYNYICENDNCIHSISEECYSQIVMNLDLRESLLKKGYNYVPNRFGFWHFINDGSDEIKKPEEVC
ncbi:hypothetical protein KAI04_03960 [Candidatus Pacearchaeota archaeon]|nr:hypothetical protein [Candidatus Pacearchaeota archaeon]